MQISASATASYLQAMKICLALFSAILHYFLLTCRHRSRINLEYLRLNHYSLADASKFGLTFFI